MGVIYSVLPVTKETIPWLEEMGVEVTGPDSRYPLIGEIYDALDQLTGYSYRADAVSVGQSWDAEISSTRQPTLEWTQITIPKCRPPVEPQEFYFSKGSPELIFRIVASLANRCGTLALSANGEDAFLVRPDSDPVRLHDEWLKTQQAATAEQSAAGQPPGLSTLLS